jgi:hypothetical protein
VSAKTDAESPIFASKSKSKVSFTLTLIEAEE